MILLSKCLLFLFEIFSFYDSKKETDMFASLLSALKAGLSFSKIAQHTNAILSLIQFFEAEYAQDKDAKKAAIDSVIQILQHYKDNP
jgi:hypothetical protein